MGGWLLFMEAVGEPTTVLGYMIVREIQYKNKDDS